MCAGWSAEEIEGVVLWSDRERAVACWVLQMGVGGVRDGEGVVER